IHIGGRAAEVGDGAGETWHLVADAFDLAQDGFFGAALDDAAFVLGDGAERAAAEAAAHDVHRGLDHLVGGNARIAIDWMWTPGIGQVEDGIEFVGFQRNGGGIDPHFLGVVFLYQHAGVVRIGFLVQHARGVGIQGGVVPDLVERGQADISGAFVELALAVQRHGNNAHGTGGIGRGFCDYIGSIVGSAALGGRVLVFVWVGQRIDAAWPIDAGGIDLGPAIRYGVADDGSAADAGHLIQGFTCGDAVGDVDDGPLGVAVEQDVGAGIDQHGFADLVAPVIVLGDAAQAGLDAADDDGYMVVGFAAALAVDDHRAVGAFAGRGVGRVGVVVADAQVGGVAVDQRVHVAAGHTEEQVGLTERLEGLRGVPLRLRDDTHAEALGLEHASDHGHAKAGVVDVGVGGNDDDVAAVPAERVHLCARHGQIWRGAEAFGPVAGIGEQMADRLFVFLSG